MIALALGVLLVAVTPTSSATAEEVSIEDRLMTQFFVDHTLSSASLPIFPACSPAFAKGEMDPNDVTKPKANYRSCAGEAKTFDGLELDARITFPPSCRDRCPWCCSCTAGAATATG